MIRGPQGQLVTDSVLKGSAAGPYETAQRIFGMVNTQLFWRWDVTVGGEESPHASAILDRMPDPSEGRLAPGAPREPGRG